MLLHGSKTCTGNLDLLAGNGVTWLHLWLEALHMRLLVVHLVHLRLGYAWIVAEELRHLSGGRECEQSKRVVGRSTK